MIKQQLPEKEICKRYLNGEGSTTIARSLNTHDKKICNILLKNKITMRKRGESNRLYTLNQDVFAQITDESAYWAGFIMADGNICNKGNNRFVLGIELAVKDKEHLERFAKFLNTNKPIYSRTRKSFNKNGTFVSLQICSEKIFKDLNEVFGITPNKTFNGKANKNVVFNKNFWRGMIDGDGCVSTNLNNKTICISLIGSLPIIKQYQKFLEKELHKTYTIHDKDSIYCVAASGLKALELGNILYSKNDLYLQRKYLKWKEANSQYEYKLHRTV